MTYNIYYGTIGKTLGVKYRFTRNCRNEQDAIKLAKNAITTFYYKNEGKYGLPSFDQINKESKITGLSIESLYDDHIEDMCRWYAIPTEEDTIPSDKLRW
jgi:hypothetical protein